MEIDRLPPEFNTSVEIEGSFPSSARLVWKLIGSFPSSARLVLADRAGLGWTACQQALAEVAMKSPSLRLASTAAGEAASVVAQSVNRAGETMASLPLVHG